MKIQHYNQANYIIAKIEGRICGESPVELYKNIKNIVSETEAKGVILDFGKVDFIDSSGLGSLIAIHTNLQKNNKEFILTSVPSNLFTLLKITNLVSILKIVDSIEDAIKKRKK